MHIAQAIIGNGGGINVIAPNMQLHVNVHNIPSECSKSNSVQSVSSGVEDEDGIPAIHLDLTKMSKPALTEIAYQLCLVCRKRYCEERESHVLPCGHHYCKNCLSQEVARLRSELTLTDQADTIQDKIELSPSVMYEKHKKSTNDPRTP